MTYRTPTFLTAFALLCAAHALAQDPPDATDDLLAPPHISIVEGAATLDRDGTIVSADAGLILASGDRLTTRLGRLEILFGDGSALHLDERTTIDLLDDDLLRLVEGRAYLYVMPSDPPFEYRIDTPAASVRTAVAGEYRIVAGPVSELAVARGFASIATSAGSLVLRSGELIQVRAGDAPGFVLPFNAAAWDPFDRWSQDRRRPRVAAITSAPLHGPLTPYNTALGQHGTWSHHADHGAVWYPHVAAGWRPFYNGRWTTIAPYGWTWVGVDPWTWPTHYYGSWGVTPAGAWFWIPGFRWRPAAVHWTVTASHIGWVPFGFGSVDVFGFTVVPRHVFNVNVIVPRHVVKVPRPTLRPLVVAATPPLPQGLVVPRAFGAQRRPPGFANRVDSGTRVRVPEATSRRVAQPRNPSPAVAGVGSDAGIRVPRPDGGRVTPQPTDRRAIQRAPAVSLAPDAPSTERQFPTAREQAPQRPPATPSLERQFPRVREAVPQRAPAPSRQLPSLRSHGGDVPSGGAEWRMPRREGADSGGAGATQGRVATPSEGAITRMPRGQNSNAGAGAAGGTGGGGVERGSVRRAEPRSAPSNGPAASAPPARAPRAETPRDTPPSRDSGGERRAAPRRSPN
jgi:hypothetical protein